MKRFAIACSALFFLSFHATAQTYLTCDFDNGIPSSFTLIDNDGNTPSSDATKQGFSVGTPWIAMTAKGDNNKFAAATSWYSPSGTSDDWMITSAFTVDEDNVRLTWRARSSMKSTSYHEKYSVYVSTTGGNTVASFDKSKPLFTIDGEAYEWTAHSVDLSAYKGKKISLAFVDESTNKAYLYIDDINVSVWSTLSAKSLIGTQVYTVRPITPTFAVTNRSEAPVYGFDGTFKCGDQTETKHFNDTIESGKTDTISFDKTIQFGKHEAKGYQLTVSDATTSYSDQGTITSYQRKTLGEEYTGTWCSWCVRGIVMLNHLRDSASDWFVGVAVHSDVMSNDYTNAVFKLYNPSGLPNGYLDREYSGVNPSDFEKYGEMALSFEPVFSSLDVKTSVPDFSKRVIKTTTTLNFGADYNSHNFRLAYVIAENNVHHPEDSTYYQYNASYSIAAGGTGGVMGGWEKLPKSVDSKDMWFHDVGRWYDTNIKGLDLLPATIKKDQPITIEHTLTIPDSVALDTLQNCDVIVMLIDGTDNHVVNCEKVQLDPNASTPVDVAARYLSLYGEATGITSTTLEGNSNRKPVAIYSLDGRRISGLQPGINIVRFSDGTCRKVLK